MAKLTWLGEDEPGIAGPSFTTAFDRIKFPKGEAVEVTDKDIIARARKNRSLRCPAFPGVLRKTSPMSRTRAELRFKVLAILTGGDVGQEPSAEDADAIDGYIDDAIIGQKHRRGVVGKNHRLHQDDADDIPNELVFQSCRVRCQCRCG
jgi:hypothetical protein